MCVYVLHVLGIFKYGNAGNTRATATQRRLIANPAIAQISRSDLSAKCARFAQTPFNGCFSRAPRSRFSRGFSRCVYMRVSEM